MSSTKMSIYIYTHLHTHLYIYNIYIYLSTRHTFNIYLNQNTTRGKIIVF